MAKVTIAIPIYNAEKYLEEAIQSVLSQTFQDFELWLVDDGSVDSSIAICEKFSSDERVKIFSDGKNLKLSVRLNGIAQNVKTEYLMRMDSDDIMHPQKLERQLAVLQLKPEIDVLGTNAYSIDENSFVVGKRYDVSLDFFGEMMPFIHPTIIAKTSWFRENLYDENAVRVEDAELWMRTKGRYVFRTLGEPLLFYREIGSQYYKKYFQGFPGVFYLLKKNFLSLTYLKFCLRYFIASFVYLIFYIFGKETVLTEKRNQCKLPKQHFSHFINHEI